MEYLMDSNKILQQLNFIKYYILANIAKPPYYYESIEELYLWVRDDVYKSEAELLIDWCLECKNIAFKIQLGELIFENNTDILTFLPKL